MGKISIVYHSGFGHTKLVAQAIYEGVRSVEGVTCELLAIVPEDIQDGRWHNDDIIKKINESDAIIFGCPTYMGSVTSVYKAFMEWAFYPWKEQTWKNKIAAGFTNSASQHGDKLNTLTDLQVFASQMGMIWVPVGDLPANNWSKGSINDINRLGSWVRLMTQSPDDMTPNEAQSKGDRLTAIRFGIHVAKVAIHWLGTPYEPERREIKEWQEDNYQRVQNLNK